MNISVIYHSDDHVTSSPLSLSRSHSLFILSTCAPFGYTIVVRRLPSLVVHLTCFCLKWERCCSIWPIKNHFVLNSKRVPLENLKRTSLERRASGGQSRDSGWMDIWLLNDLFSVISIITAVFSPSHCPHIKEKLMTHEDKESRYTVTLHLQHSRADIRPTAWQQMWYWF